MEQTREEILQQRLRGAQRRQIKDVDFDFAIPTVPLISSPPPNEGVSQSIASLLQLPPPISHPTTTPSAPAGRAPKSILSLPNDANTSAKRRKLNHEPPVSPSSGGSTRSLRSQPRPDIYTITNDVPRDRPDLTRGDAIEVPLTASAETERIPETQDSIAAAIPEPQPIPSVHFADDSLNILADGTSFIESLHQESGEDSVSRLLEAGRVEDVQLTEVETPVPTRKRNKAVRPARRSRRNPMSSVEDDLDELSPQQVSTIKKIPSIHRNPRQEDDDQDPLSDPLEREDAEETNDAEAAKVLSKSKGKRKSIDPAPAPTFEEESQDVVVPQRKRQRLDLNRAKQRQPKHRGTHKPSSSTKRSNKALRTSGGEPIAVTVHRLTEGLLYEGDDQDIDILNAEFPNVKRAGVNAVDTLIQVCKESFTRQLETLHTGRTHSQDKAAKKEYNNKYRAIDTFSEEVYARLTDHTINLDNTYSLNKRLATARRRKLNLRDELMRVRSERNEVAHRMDEVRSRHEKESGVGGNLITLNRTLHDIEVAIDRGKEHNMQDADDARIDWQSTELQYTKVAEMASVEGNGGGLLAYLRSFNAFLERSALALEARRV